MKAAHAVWLPVLLFFSNCAHAQFPAPEIVGIGPHHRVLQRVSIAPDERGELVQSESSYTEIATGLNWWNPKTETWEETVEAFEILPQGYAVARRGQHKVMIAGNLNTGGAVDIELPDGRRMLSNPMGLSYFDVATGRNVLLAEVKDCTGELAEPNVLLFADAFDTIKAALSYTYLRGQFEQDVVIYQDPGPPEDYGLKADTTLLEIYTEIFEAPEPVAVIAGDSGQPEDLDPVLDFGSMRMEQGTAYFLHRQLEDAAMQKLWHSIEGRQFLIERIPYREVEPLLQKLEARVERPSARWLADRTVEDRAGIARLLTPRRPGLELAAIPRGRAPLEPGVVLDYLTLNSTQTNQVFKGDTTYFVTGPVYLYGTTTFEGGTVVKFTNSVSPTLATGPHLSISGNVVWEPTAYRPAVFTAKDDNSVGEAISGSSGTPSGDYAYTSLRFYSPSASLDLRHFRISHSLWGMILYGPNAHQVRHGQFIACGSAVYVDQATAAFQNLLLNGMTAQGFYFYNSASAVGQHLTLHRVNRVKYSSGTLALTNSLLVGVTNWTYSFTGANNATNSSSAVFQQVGAGAHYLAAGSPYRNAGTANITPSLAKELQSLTTYPPLVLSNSTVLNATLAPQAARDTDGLDLGYHYPPLDWVVNTLTVTNGGTLVLTNGVVLATYGDTGIWLRDASRLLSEGTPGQRNGIVRYTTVQEQSTNWGNGSPSGNVAVNPYNTGASPSAEFRFTTFSTLARDGYHLYTSQSGGWTLTNLVMRDCELFGGLLSLENPVSMSVSLVNNLGEQVAVWLNGYGPVNCYNGLFRGGSFDILRLTSVNPWVLRDNVFESPGSILSSGNPITGYNAYINTTNRIYPTNATDKVLSSFTWATGPLGRYYQVSTNLIRTGSRIAPEAGLFHFTVTTNQAKAGTNTVSIGYHYVALDGDNLPLDYDADGIPDYLEDRNGNGSVDSGETNWQTYNSQNGLSGTPDLQVFTPLKP